ncbi:MAG: BatD family protein [Betaproteobacteria bacterium]|nr:BatD family protein [Betaproteobacteria bacterium]
MVRRLIFCLAVAGTANAWAVTAQLDRKNLALGEPLTLSLSGKAAVLEQLDLTPLKADFELFGRTLSRSDAQGTLQLTLYPLRTGKLAIPALGGGGERSRGLPVTVTAGSESMPEARFKLHTEPARPFVRQPTRLTLEICDDGSLEWKRPALPLTSLAQHRALGEEQVEVEYDGRRCTAHRYHWAVLPTQAGEIALPLPMLDAGKFGQRLRLPPPGAAFDAQAVPGWLPLNVPVGKPTVSTEALPEEWPIERPLAWRFSVEGGYSIDGMKALLALHLQSHAAWRGYPPTVEALAPEDRNSPLNRLAVTLYASPAASGPLSTPALALPYFDPATARLEQTALPTTQVRIYDPLWRKLGQVALVLFGYVLLQAATHLIGREVQWRQTRRAALKAIPQATSYAGLAQCLKTFHLRPDTPTATTLRRWLGALRQQARDDAALDVLVADIEACHYGQGQTDLEELKRQALATIAGLRPRYSWHRQ